MTMKKKVSTTKPIKKHNYCYAVIKPMTDYPYYDVCDRLTLCREVKAGCGHIANICPRCFNAGRIVRHCCNCYETIYIVKDNMIQDMTSIIVESIEHK
jgi:hypothetical protein